MDRSCSRTGKLFLGYGLANFLFKLAKSKTDLQLNFEKSIGALGSCMILNAS